MSSNLISTLARGDMNKERILETHKAWAVFAHRAKEALRDVFLQSIFPTATDDALERFEAVEGEDCR